MFLPLLRHGVDPLPELARVRSEQPVHKLDVLGTTVWIVTRYDDARQVLGDSTGFGNDFSYLAAAAGDALPDLPDPGGLGFRDPPEHTRLRKLMASAFTPRRLAALAPRVEQLVAEQLERMAETGPPADLVAQFAGPIPGLVIGELLGVPSEERAEFARISSHRFDLLESVLAPLESASQSQDYLVGLVARQRDAPGDGLLGLLITEHGDELSDRDLAGLADGLLVGGQETTVSMLALGSLVLLLDPVRAEGLRSGVLPVESVVEELLRHLTVVQVAFPRFARTDVVVGGQPIPAGAPVVCSLVAANRDENLAGDVDELDLSRAPTPHLAFGHGIHHCLGASLARMELRTAYPALLRRFPDLRLAAGLDELSFPELSLVYGVRELPVTW